MEKFCYVYSNRMIEILEFQEALSPLGVTTIGTSRLGELPELMRMQSSKEILALLVWDGQPTSDFLEAKMCNPALSHAPALELSDLPGRPSHPVFQERLARPLQRSEIQARVEFLLYHHQLLFENQLLHQKLQEKYRFEDNRIVDFDRFKVFFEREWRRCLRYDWDMSLLKLVLNFQESQVKSWRAFEESLKDSARRPGDMVASLGPGHYIAVLSETDSGGALQVAERIKTACAEFPALSIETLQAITRKPKELYGGLVFREGTSVAGEFLHLVIGAEERY